MKINYQRSNLTVSIKWLPERKDLSDSCEEIVSLSWQSTCFKYSSSPLQFSGAYASRYSTAEFLALASFPVQCRNYSRRNDFLNEIAIFRALGYLTPDKQSVIEPHECDRICVAGEKPRVCHYKFKVELYNTLNKVRF